MSNDIWQELRDKNPVVAVLVVDEMDDAVPLARALLAGGVGAMELTMRTPAALESLRWIQCEVPEMAAGAGTVLTPEQVREVKAAGAQFAVAPGMQRRVLEAAAEQGLPFAPGIATPSDIEAALEFDCRVMKFFPATPMGGLDYLKSMAAPYLHLGLQFIPLGGLNEGNLSEWISSPLVCAVGGSWIAPRELIREKNWAEITNRAANAARIAEMNRRIGNSARKEK